MKIVVTGDNAKEALDKLIKEYGGTYGITVAVDSNALLKKQNTEVDVERKEVTKIYTPGFFDMSGLDIDYTSEPVKTTDVVKTSTETKIIKPKVIKRSSTRNKDFSTHKRAMFIQLMYPENGKPKLTLNEISKKYDVATSFLKTLRVLAEQHLNAKARYSDK